MPSDRVKSAARQLEHINEETETELEELQEAIQGVESLHEEHMEELRDDKEFIEDLKILHKEIQMIQRIEEHMYSGLEAYGENKITAEAFKKRYIRDEEKLAEVVNDINSEISEMIELIEEEEVLTKKDFNVEEHLDDLVEALGEEQENLTEAHENIEETLMG